MLNVDGYAKFIKLKPWDGWLKGSILEAALFPPKLTNVGCWGLTFTVSFWICSEDLTVDDVARCVEKIIFVKKETCHSDDISY